MKIFFSQFFGVRPGWRLLKKNVKRKPTCSLLEYFLAYQILLVSFFHVPVKNSWLNCIYQRSGFCLWSTLCSVSTQDLLLPSTTITILIMGYNSHWNSVNMWLTMANYQENNPHLRLHFVLSAYTNLPWYPLPPGLISHLFFPGLQFWLPNKLAI